MKPNNNNYIINEKIRFPEVRVVSSEGEQLGIMTTKKALDLAKMENLDLIIITEQASPPVARIFEFSKFKYEINKKEKENAKKNRQNKIEIKEIAFRLNIDSADLERLQYRAVEWVEKGNKVKINLNLKGRENHHKEKGKNFLNKFINEIPNSVIEGKISDANRGLTALISGKK